MSDATPSLPVILGRMLEGDHALYEKILDSRIAFDFNLLCLGYEQADALRAEVAELRGQSSKLWADNRKLTEDNKWAVDVATYLSARNAALRKALENTDIPHQINALRSIAQRCEEGCRYYDLLHDIWKVMDALELVERALAQGEENDS